MIDVNVDLLQWFINFFDKKPSSSSIKNENISDKKLVEELHKPIGKKTTLTFYGQYLWCRFSRYAINK